MLPAMKTKRVVARTVLALLAAAGTAAAATYNVSPGPANSATNLRQAVIDANNNPGADTIALAAGLYEFKQSGRNEDAAATGDLDILEPVTITGAGADSTIIDGADLDRIFHILTTTGAYPVAIADLTIRNGTPGTGTDEVGGGLRNDGGTLTLTRTKVLDGLARQGGGVYSVDATLVLDQCVVRNNRAVAGTAGQGGGIYFRETGAWTLQLLDSIVDGNWASDDGGGIENFEGTVEIEGSTVSGNYSGDDGGGIENDNHGTGGYLTIRNSAFVNNTAWNGGAIDNDGWVTALNLTIAGNRATNTAKEAWGSGGIRNSEDTAVGIQVTLTNCTVYGNLAVTDGSLTLKPGDISNISPLASEVRMKNAILGTCLSHVDVGQNGTFVSWGDNVIEDSSGCQLSSAGGAPPDTHGDPKLGTLSDNGTAGNAHMPLMSDSPAIDAADEAAAPSNDQLGQPRIDGDDQGGTEPDIGAIEFAGQTGAHPGQPEGLQVKPFVP